MIRRLAGGRVFTNYHDEAWHTSLFRLALIALMAGSFAAGPVVLRMGLTGQWSGYAMPLAALAAIVGALTTAALGRPSWRDRRGALFRAGEAVLLLLVARLAAWAFVEGPPTLAEVGQWLLAPGLFFSGEFLFAAFTALFSWVLAIAAAADFAELAIQPDEVAARESREWGDSKSQWRAGQPRSRVEILQGFAVRWLGLGALLIVCAALTRVNVAVNDAGVVRIGLRGLGMRGEVIAALVCYFLAGLLLMSHGRLAVLRGRWYNQEVEIAPALIRRWHSSSVLFVFVVALTALLLPLGATGWLARALEWVIALVARILMALTFIFSLIFGLIMRFLEMLFGLSSEPPLEELTPTPTPQPIPTQAEMTSQLPPWLGGAVLWTVVGIIALFLLLNFLRASGVLQGRFGARLVSGRLWWRARQARFAQTARANANRLRATLRRARRIGAAQPGRARAKEPKLPREQVRRYYLAALEEAAEAGVPRRSDQTPAEFAEELAAQRPDADPAIAALTDAFEDARYSAREIDAQEVSAARLAWERLTQGLRRRPNSDQSR